MKLATLTKQQKDRRSKPRNERRTKAISTQLSDEVREQLYDLSEALGVGHCSIARRILEAEVPKLLAQAQR